MRHAWATSGPGLTGASHAAVRVRTAEVGLAATSALVSAAPRPCVCLRSREHRVEHGGREPAGLRVLARRVVAAEEGARPRPGARPPWPKRGRGAAARARARRGARARRPRRSRRAPRGRAVAERGELAARNGAQRASSPGVGRLPGGTQRQAFVTYAPGSAEAVVPRARGRLRREAGAVQRGVEEVARAVAGEHAPGAVRAVRPGASPRSTIRAAGSPNPGTPRPSTPPRGRPRALARDLLAPRDEPRAGAAGGDLSRERGEREGAIGVATVTAILAWRRRGAPGKRGAPRPPGARGRGRARTSARPPPRGAAIALLALDPPLRVVDLALRDGVRHPFIPTAAAYASLAFAFCFASS